MIAFVLCVGSSIWVLVPHAFVFSFRGQTLVTASDRGGDRDVTAAYRAAGSWIEVDLESNARKILGLSRWLTMSCALLAVEVVLWILGVAG